MRAKLPQNSGVYQQKLMASALSVHCGQEGTYDIGVTYVCYSVCPFQEYFVLSDESDVAFFTINLAFLLAGSQVVTLVFVDAYSCSVL